jgi:nucleotide-binding universal stress UspA family protein
VQRDRDFAEVNAGEYGKRQVMMKFLVAIDGSPASLRAVNLAIEFATRRDADVILLNVQNLLMLGPSTELMAAAWIEEEEQGASEEVLRNSVASCRAAGVPFKARSERGAPAATIDQIAREENVDHIVMGTRGLGSIRGLLVGSVATQVLHLVEVPVTLVK